MDENYIATRNYKKYPKYHHVCAVEKRLKVSKLVCVLKFLI